MCCLQHILWGLLTPVVSNACKSEPVTMIKQKAKKEEPFKKEEMNWGLSNYIKL